MNIYYPLLKMKKGLTLIEMTIVILVLLILTGIGMQSAQWIGAWRLGKLASETLRSVHAAQRMYVADNPLAAVAGFDAALIDPYVIGGPPVAPAPIDGAALQIIYNFIEDDDTSPMLGQLVPIVDQGGRYDRSTTNFDGLWDIGTL